MSQVDRTFQNELPSSSSTFGPSLETPSRELERTAENVLAKLTLVKPDKRKLEVEALFKIVTEDHDQGETRRLRLWRLWGNGDIENETILASCEYDPDTFEVPQDRIFFAFQTLNSHRINEHSYTVKVHPVDSTGLKPEARSVALKPAAATPMMPQVKEFQSLMGNLAPGHTILIRIKIENHMRFIDPEHVAVVRAISTPVSPGFGSFPEEGTNWGLVERVTPEGQVEIAAEYKVLKSRPTSTKNNWRAQFEKTSNERKLFSLIYFKQSP